MTDARSILILACMNHHTIALNTLQVVIGVIVLVAAGAFLFALGKEVGKHS